MVDDAAPVEGWEARRMEPPARLPWEVREARRDARLLLLVVRARLREGRLPLEHAGRLAEAAEDPRLTTRMNRVAAELLARFRFGVLPLAGRRG